MVDSEISFLYQINFMTLAKIVPQIKVHPQGPHFSRLIYGTWRLLDAQDASTHSPQSIIRRIELCIELGITTFDLADIYGGGGHQCEMAFGAALALNPGLRSQIQLITKVRSIVACC
jgi:predicted oxidoreductase